MSKSKELATISSEFAVMTTPQEDINEVMASNLGGDGLSVSDIETVKVPSGGGRMFTINDLEQGEVDVAEIMGIPILWQRTRGMWAESFDSNPGQPPLCRSTDGITGDLNRDHPEYETLSADLPEGVGGDCEACPYSKYGSADDNVRQRCKEMRRIFLLQKDNLLPIMLSAPPTSIKAFKKFMTGLMSRAIPYYACVVTIGLEQDTNARGIKFSKLTLKAEEVLRGEQRDAIRAYHESIKPMLMDIPVDDE